MASSGTTLFQPSITDLMIESFSRIQIRGAALTVEHVIDARRTLNLILQDWSGNRGVNLWKVTLDFIPLVPGRVEYQLPFSFIQLLDIYVRQVTVGTTATTIGNALTAIVDQTGAPIISQTGEPIVQQPGSGVFTTISGNQIITMNWPLHGLSVGTGFQFVYPTTAGGIQLPSICFVDSVIDPNTLTFLVPEIPTLSETGSGGTPLFSTTNTSTAVLVLLQDHKLQVGNTFNVAKSTTVGGLTLLGNYTVATTPTPYSFTITAPAPASSTAVIFENSGQIGINTQNSSINPIDIVMYPISRTEYAAIPDKFDVGRPTTFWFERTINPVIHIWQSPDQVYGLGVYSMRQIQDANPISGQTLDLPNRMFPVLCAELTAGLAEKYAPQQFAAKMQLAQAMWTRASLEDVENVPLFITPGLSGYYQ